MHRTDRLLHTLGPKAATIAAAGILLVAGLAQIGTAAADEPSTTAPTGPSDALMAPVGAPDPASMQAVFTPLSDGETPLPQAVFAPLTDN